MSCDGHGRKSSQQERAGFIKRANQIYFCLRIENYLMRSLRIWLNLIAAALFTAALHAQAAAAAPAAKIDLTGLVPACPAFAKALFTGAAADRCEITAFGSVDTDTDPLIYELYSDAGGDNAIVLSRSVHKLAFWSSISAQPSSARSRAIAPATRWSSPPHPARAPPRCTGSMIFSPAITASNTSTASPR